MGDIEGVAENQCVREDGEGDDEEAQEASAAVADFTEEQVKCEQDLQTLGMTLLSELQDADQSVGTAKDLPDSCEGIDQLQEIIAEAIRKLSVSRSGIYGYQQSFSIRTRTAGKDPDPSPKFFAQFMLLETQKVLTLKTHTSNWIKFVFKNEQNFGVEKIQIVVVISMKNVPQKWRRKK